MLRRLIRTVVYYCVVQYSETRQEGKKKNPKIKEEREEVYYYFVCLKFYEKINYLSAELSTLRTTYYLHIYKNKDSTVRTRVNIIYRGYDSSL